MSTQLRPHQNDAIERLRFAPLCKWLADVEAVLTGKNVITYRNRVTNIQYVCIPTRIFEHDGELWVVGTDPACNCITGEALRLCSVSRVDRARER